MFLPAVSLTTSGPGWSPVVAPRVTHAVCTFTNGGSVSFDVSFDGATLAFTVPTGKSFTTALDEYLGSGVFIRRIGSDDVGPGVVQLVMQTEGGAISTAGV